MFAEMVRLFGWTKTLGMGRPIAVQRSTTPRSAPAVILKFEFSKFMDFMELKP